MVRFFYGFALVAAFFSGNSEGGVITDISPSDLVGGVGTNSSDFLGVVTSVGTASAFTAGTASINTPVPSVVNIDALTGSIAINDVVGRDLESSGGNFTGASWFYELFLPAEALPGTGLTNIQFDADLFRTVGGTYESSDDIRFNLFLNGQTLASDSVIFEASGSANSVSLSPVTNFPTLIQSARVVASIPNSSAFTVGGESFAVSAATLSADFTAVAVPEPTSLAFFLPALWWAYQIRRRSAARLQSS